MPVHLITYDLLTPGKDYRELHKAIRALGSWWHCLESAWLVVSDQTSLDIATVLMRHVDINDKLLVVDLRGNWASLHLSDECNDWLRSRM